MTASESSLTPGTHRLQVVAYDPVMGVDQLLKEIDLSETTLIAGNVPAGFLSEWQPTDISVTDILEGREIQFRFLSDGTQQVSVAIDAIEFIETSPKLVTSPATGTVENNELRFESGQAQLNLRNAGREILEILAFEIDGPFTIANPIDSVTHLVGNEFAYPLQISADNIDGDSTGTLRIRSNDPDAPLVELQLSSDKVVLADLRGVAFDVLTDHVLLGEAEVTFEIENAGDGPAGSFDVGFVWSPNDVIGDEDDVPLTGQEIAIAGLASSASVFQTTTLQLDRRTLYDVAVKAAPLSFLAAQSNEIGYVGLIIDPADKRRRV